MQDHRQGRERDQRVGRSGARDYDPATGRFISVDPLLELDKPQTIGGYAYSAHNPTTYSDPTGTWLDDGTGHSEPRNDGGGGGGGSWWDDLSDWGSDVLDWGKEKTEPCPPLRKRPGP